MRNIGKSAYALKVAKEVYMALGYSEDDAWKKAINEALIFSMRDIIKTIRKYDKPDVDRLPIMIVDDSGVHLSSLNYFTDIKLAAILKSLFDLVRTSTACLVMTCPDSKSMMKSIRNQPGQYSIRIIADGTISPGSGSRYNRHGVCYQRVIIPSGRNYTRKVFRDNFSCYIPPKYYKKYMAKRHKYSEQLLNDLEAKLKKKSGSTKKRKRENIKSYGKLIDEVKDMTEEFNGEEHDT